MVLLPTNNLVWHKIIHLLHLIRKQTACGIDSFEDYLVYLGTFIFNCCTEFIKQFGTLIYTFEMCCFVHNNYIRNLYYCIVLINWTFFIVGVYIACVNRLKNIFDFFFLTLNGFKNIYCEKKKRHKTYSGSFNFQTGNCP